MGRPAGSHNPHFEATRASLLRALHARLAAPGGVRTSFRELAAAAGVSVATLRHYFGSREGAIAALMAYWHKEGQRHMLEVATGPLQPVRESLAWMLEMTADGFRQGLADVHAIGLSAGLREPTLGPAYLCQVLDPSLEAIGARLARHIARDELRAGDVRHMALMFASPALLSLLHQGPLGGDRARPLHWERFAEEHVAAFLRAFGTGYEAPPDLGAATPAAEGASS